MKNMRAKDWVAEVIALDMETCSTPPFFAKSLYWNGEVLSVSRIVCAAKNGEHTDLLMVPVRDCGTPRCGNGKHYHWGTKSEAQFKAAGMGYDRSGEKNPNSKLNWEIVRKIRSIDLGVKSGSITYSQAMTRREMAHEYGVSLRTIDQVARGKIWVEEPDPYADKQPLKFTKTETEETEGDEF